MREIQQNQTTQPILFGPLVQTADHMTAATGLSPTVTISKAGAAFASPAGAVSEVGNGYYKIAPNAADANTKGNILVNAVGVGADPYCSVDVMVVGYDPLDAVRLGLTSLPNAAAEASGGLFTRGSGAGQINQPGNGLIDVSLKAILNTILTETSGLIAAAFKNFFNIATPTGTVNSLPAAIPGANNGLPLGNSSGHVTVAGYASGQDPATLVFAHVIDSGGTPTTFAQLAGTQWAQVGNPFNSSYNNSTHQQTTVYKDNAGNALLTTILTYDAYGHPTGTPARTTTPVWPQP